MSLETISPGWRKIVAVVCILSFLAVSVGHVADRVANLQAFDKKGKTAISVPATLCPACAALHSSVIEPGFSDSADRPARRAYLAASYQSRPVSGEFLQFFVRPPPAA